MDNNICQSGIFIDIILATISIGAKNGNNEKIAIYVLSGFSTVGDMSIIGIITIIVNGVAIEFASCIWSTVEPAAANKVAKIKYPDKK